jgi:hypothetical protein
MLAEIRLFRAVIPAPETAVSQPEGKNPDAGPKPLNPELAWYSKYLRHFPDWA